MKAIKIPNIPIKHITKTTSQNTGDTTPTPSAQRFSNNISIEYCFCRDFSGRSLYVSNKMESISTLALPLSLSLHGWREMYSFESQCSTQLDTRNEIIIFLRQTWGFKSCKDDLYVKHPKFEWYSQSRTPFFWHQFYAHLRFTDNSTSVWKENTRALEGSDIFW